MTTMPIGYSYGISILNSHFFSGAKIILNKNNIFQKNFWEYFNKYKVNSLNGVPAFYEYIKKLKLEKLNVKNLLYISQAGGKMEYKTKKYIFNYCKKLNIKFYIMYGQTEASPRISCFEVSKYPKKINSVGKSIASVNIEINKEKNTKTVKKINFKLMIMQILDIMMLTLVYKYHILIKKRGSVISITIAINNEVHKYHFYQILIIY